MTDFELNALLLSIKIGLASTMFILIPGIFIAWILAKKNFFGKTIIDALVHLPLVIPPIGIGYILLVSFGNESLLGNFFYACSIMSFPLLVRPIRVLIEAQDNQLEFAAKTLGSSNIKIFFTITLPLAYPGILAGFVLSFARSIGEFGATIAFVGNIPGEPQTLPLALWLLIETSDNNTEIIRLGIISISLALSALLIATSIEKTFLRRLRNNN